MNNKPVLVQLMAWRQFLHDIMLLIFTWIDLDDITNGHYGDVIMGTMASQITSLIIVYSTVYSGVHQRKHQSSASLAFVRGIHWSPVNSPHKWPVTRKMFPFYDVIMGICDISARQCWCHTYPGSENVTTTMHVDVLQNLARVSADKYLLQNIDLKWSFQECYQQFWMLKSNVSNMLSPTTCLCWIFLT